MRPWKIELNVDRGTYRVDLRRRTYEYVSSNPRWRDLSPEQNARNKRQLHGLALVFRDGSTKVFIDRTWPFTEDDPCPTSFGWVPGDSPCDHDKYECPSCGRRQCVLHWRYPMKTQREAIHFLKSVQVETGSECFVRPVEKQRANHTDTAWKIFTSEQDYQSYLTTGHDRR
jgi:hypothetical protein